MRPCAAWAVSGRPVFVLELESETSHSALLVGLGPNGMVERIAGTAFNRVSDLDRGLIPGLATTTTRSARVTSESFVFGSSS